MLGISYMTTQKTLEPVVREIRKLVGQKQVIFKHVCLPVSYGVIDFLAKVGAERSDLFVGL